MRKLIYAYILFWLKAIFQKKSKSSFTKKIINDCFKSSKHFSEYNSISDYRKLLLNNQTKILVTDLGAGSQTIKTNERIVSKMAKNAGSTYFRSKMLFRLVSYLRCKSILEFGTSMGISTHAMAIANSNAKITSIEGCPNIAAFTKNQLEINKVKNAEIKTSNFDDILPELVLNKYDLIYIDGNHQKEATIKYFETLLKSTHQNSVMIFDDIYWSKDMTEAWNTIIKHPKVSLSIDTFFWGIVFFNSEIEKEHHYLSFI